MSQNKCINCGTLMGCSCQRRVASDGHGCCSSCLGSYENTIRKPGTPHHNNHAATNPGSANQIGSLYPRAIPAE